MLSRRQKSHRHYSDARPPLYDETAAVPIPSSPPRRFPPLFQLERARLSELLGSLSPADWGRPSPCPGWNVLGLASHLLGDDLSLMAGQRDRHHGTPAPQGSMRRDSSACWTSCRAGGSRPPGGSALSWAYPSGLEPHQRPAGEGVEVSVTGPGVELRWDLVSDGTAWTSGPRPAVHLSRSCV